MNRSFITDEYIQPVKGSRRCNPVKTETSCRAGSQEQTPFVLFCIVWMRPKLH